MRCGDCKHWGVRDGRDYLLNRDGLALCGRVGDENDRLDAGLPPSGLAYTYGDLDERYSGLLTRADFGCVLFEPKGGGDAPAGV